MIDFATARYIKLGQGGCWNDVSLDNSEIHFGYGTTSHQIASKGNFEAIREEQLKFRNVAASATSDAREIFEFYTLGEDCIWITFARSHLWWTFAGSEIVWLGGDKNGADLPAHGQRKRKCQPWSKVDVEGAPLTVQSISSALTKLSAYRRTICQLGEAEDYFRRRLNCQPHPVVADAKATQQSLTQAIENLIGLLHQDDFETLVDLIFTRSGWSRISSLGGTQEFIDLAIEQPVTGERAAVQVKSNADPAALRAYVDRFDQAQVFSRLFFVCNGELNDSIINRPDLHIWDRAKISALVQRHGLIDWLFAKLV